MAIDVEQIIMDALLSIVEVEGVPLEKVTVKRLLDTSGVSRQTFYNHFLDKADLICKVYDRCIISEFDLDAVGVDDFRSALLASYRRMREHIVFMRQACLDSGQNCLRDYLFEHSRSFDLAWHQRLWGEDPIPDELRFATEYHAMAATSMSLSWVLSGCPVPEEELVDLTVQMRAIGMERLFSGASGAGNPYLRQG